MLHRMVWNVQVGTTYDLILVLVLTVSSTHMIIGVFVYARMLKNNYIVELIMQALLE